MDDEKKIEYAKVRAASRLEREQERLAREALVRKANLLTDFLREDPDFLWTCLARLHQAASPWMEERWHEDGKVVWFRYLLVEAVHEHDPPGFVDVRLEYTPGCGMELTWPEEVLGEYPAPHLTNGQVTFAVAMASIDYELRQAGWAVPEQR